MYMFPRYSSYQELALRSFAIRWAIMSFSIIQSPFSHAEMYGTSASDIDHSKTTSKDPSLHSTSSSPKKKSKPSKSKLMHGRASTESHHSKQKSKKKKQLPKSSLHLTSSTKTSHKSSSKGLTFSLPQVDSDLPVKLHPTTHSKYKHTSTTTPLHPITHPSKNTPTSVTTTTSSRPTRTKLGKEQHSRKERVTGGCGAAIQSTTNATASTTTTNAIAIKSTATTTTAAVVTTNATTTNATTAVAATTTTTAAAITTAATTTTTTATATAAITATSNTVMTSLLAHSTMSTSDIVLSFSKSNKDISTSGGGSKVRWGRCVPNMNLPPHMRIHRQTLTRTLTTPQGRFGRRGEGGLPASLEDIARELGRLQYRNVIVMSGAGISTPSGIPDFRTPGTGLYDNLQQYNIPDPTSIFDITYFSHHPKAFFTLARELYPGKYKPSLTHLLVKLLQDKKILLRSYTQNIDGLERIAGVQGGKLVEAHGSFASASCIKCKTKQDVEEVKEAIFEKRLPRCKHKHCFGLVKPDIVFFGEDLPSRFHTLQLPDFAKCDLLIIMGTSLEVEPFASLVSLPRVNVPRLLLNRELVGPFKHQRKRPTDIAMTGDLVGSVRELVRCAGWEDDMDVMREHHNLPSEEEEGALWIKEDCPTSTHAPTIGPPPPPVEESVLVEAMSKITIKDVHHGNHGDDPPERGSTLASSEILGVNSTEESSDTSSSSSDTSDKSSEVNFSAADSYDNLEWRMTCGTLSDAHSHHWKQ